MNTLGMDSHGTGHSMRGPEVIMTSYKHYISCIAGFYGGKEAVLGANIKSGIKSCFPIN